MIPPTAHNLQLNTKLSYGETVVAATIATLLRKAIARTYYLSRLKDTANTGYPIIDTKQDSISLGITPQTLVRDIRQCQKEGLFHSVVSLGRGRYKVQYISQRRLAIKLGTVPDACYPATIDDVRHIDKFCVECITDMMQCRSYLAQKKATNKANQEALAKQEVPRYQTPTLEDLLNLNVSGHEEKTEGADGALTVGVAGKLTGNQTRAKLFHARTRRFLLCDSNCTPWGVSQSKVAQIAGKSRTTIRRKLDHRYRSDRQLEPIPKVQMAIAADYGINDFKQLAEETQDADWKKVIFYDKRAYYPLPNVYRINRESKKMLFAKRWVSRILSGESPCPTVPEKPKQTVTKQKQTKERAIAPTKTKQTKTRLSKTDLKKIKLDRGLAVNRGRGEDRVKEKAGDFIVKQVGSIPVKPSTGLLGQMITTVGAIAFGMVCNHPKIKLFLQQHDLFGFLFSAKGLCG